VDVDARKYLRIGPTSSLLAFRFRGFHSRGSNPGIYYFGGNNEMRGFPYLGFQGNTGFHANAELRVPIIKIALTPLGVVGDIRGTAYFDMGGAHWDGQPWTAWTSDPGYSYVGDPVFGEYVSGFRLVDAQASWGFGVTVPFLGYPLNFNWTKLTDLKTSTPWRFNFWMGVDF
jgi:outer membrane protein assembly factor BamA